MAKISIQHYAEGSAPFGELDIVMPRAEGKGDFGFVSGAATSIIRAAWLESDWFAEAVGRYNLDTLAGDPSLPFEERTHHGVNAGMRSRTGCVALAVAPPRPGEDCQDARTIKANSDRWDWVHPNRYIGFATGAVDISGNAFERAYKRLRHPEKVYDKLGDVNVVPDRQREGIGAALAHVVLQALPDGHPSTVYVAETNTALQHRLTQLGYEMTGSQPRPDLLGEHYPALNEVRMQANAVEQVRENLVTKYPWLQAAKAL